MRRKRRKKTEEEKLKRRKKKNEEEELKIRTTIEAICRRQWNKTVRNPLEGGVEYLHRDPASRRSRRRGKSEI
jgi:hypothetical protein